jgi:tRNA1Val (adenine37-N6)-methyltransferase
VEEERAFVTEDTLLGGRLRYRQARDGFRTGLEPVLLAASVPARSGQRVLEAGIGAGAASLCLASRRPGVWVLGVERDPRLAALAAENVACNGLRQDIAVLAADVRRLPILASFDHVMSNPPWHDAHGTQSLSSSRALAKSAPPACFPPGWRRWRRASARGGRFR